MTAAEVREVILAFPGVEESFSQGSPAFRVAGKVLARVGSRVTPDDLQLTGVGSDEAEFLIDSAPRTFHTTPHYRGANYLLARMGELRPDQLHALIERRWRQIAPKRLVAQARA